ncbi:MAG: hypothetical protein GY862_23145 [Gammaproteobacteria bacterium]|nr:hypothetical protein [Gammaproteobacteria bacterium]
MGQSNYDRRSWLNKKYPWLNKKYRLAVLGAAVFISILLWAGFNIALEMSNQEAFCISCHQMRDNVYQEYKKTIHYRNRTGVRATCPDCHVPKEWGHMLVRKVKASNELFHALAGSIDTREKFLAKRLKLAKGVWRDMEKTNSRECRNCHRFEFMDMNQQAAGVSDKHREAQQRGMSCINCHKGIAHNLPEEFIEAEHVRYEKEKVPCTDCHKSMARPEDY